MKTVLLIDDDADIRTVLARYLRTRGWAVLEAPDGESGLHLAKKHLPSAVVCDLLMPRANGFQLCTAIRNEDALRHTAVIAMSGRAYEANRLNAHEAGADAFLFKPIDTDELIRILTELTADGTNTEPPKSAGPMVPLKPTQIRFWGVRGSIPTPGPETVHYGGNTSCVEVRADGELIIMDSGTGIRPLGLSLTKEFSDQPIRLTLLVTHTHWDHVQGFPFFSPAYNSKNHIRVLGYEGARNGLSGILNSQMESPYFPIGLGALPSHIVIEELREMGFSIGPVKVRAEFMNHPGVCVGFRLFTSTGSVVYMPDNEPFYRARSQKDTSVVDRRQLVEHDQLEGRKLADFVRDADVLIIDSQYDAAEYQQHVGWGHGCVEDVVRLAVRGNVKKLLLFHHDPSHDDKQVAKMVEEARRIAASQVATIEIDAAREGMTVQVNSAVP